MSEIMPAKDPSDITPYFFVWCKDDGTNVAGGDGMLQGETISSYTLSVATGITKTTDNKAAVTITDPAAETSISYGISTVVTVWLSAGTTNTDYDVSCTIVTNGSPARTLKRTMTIPVRTL